MYEKIILDISNKAEDIQECDYIKNGLYYCGKCNTPKQCKIILSGKEQIVNCICECKKELQHKIEEEEKAKEKERLRLSILGEKLSKATFENSQIKNHIFKGGKLFCENIDEFIKDGKGLLLYGNTGTGKTYLAACILNELIDKGYKCYFGKMRSIVNDIQSSWEGRNEYIEKITKRDVIVIDDLGCENATAYMQENVYNLINAIYEKRKVLIVTTNLTANELKYQSDVDFKRSYSRISEICHPILFKGDDERIKKARSDYEKTKKLLGV